jgi:capsular exopolysaccharide synthesis family protein
VRSPGSKFTRFVQSLRSKGWILVGCTLVGTAAGLVWDVFAGRFAGKLADNPPQEQIAERSKLAEADALLHTLLQNIASLKQVSARLLETGDTDHPALVQSREPLRGVLVDAQKRTLECRTSLVSLRRALASGSSLQPFLQQLSVDTSLRDSVLESVTARPATKPEVASHANRDAAAPQLKPSIPPDLGPKLLEMAHQRLSRAHAHEETLRQLDESIQRETALRNQQAAEIQTLEETSNRLSAWNQPTLVRPEPSDRPADFASSVGAAVTAAIRATPVILANSPSLIYGTYIGLISGIVLLVVQGILNRSNTISVDALQQRLGLPVLAEIHKLPLSAGTGFDAITTFAGEGSDDSKPFLNLRSAITFSMKNPRRLMVSSTAQGDGKTTVITNLAVAFCQANRKTLLIDADVRSGGTTTLFNLQRSRGLTQILRDNQPINQSCLENIFNLGIENLDVMPAGPFPFDLRGLLASERFGELIDWAESNYDQILFDAPSVSYLEDLQLIGRFVDGALLVVRRDQNRQKEVCRAINSCREANVPFSGFVINETTLERRAEPSERSTATDFVMEDETTRLAA